MKNLLHEILKWRLSSEKPSILLTYWTVVELLLHIVNKKVWKLFVKLYDFWTLKIFNFSSSHALLSFLHVPEYFVRNLENVHVLMIVWEVTYVKSVHLHQVRNLCTHDRMGWDLRSMYRVFNCTRYVIYVPMIEWDEIYVECTECTTAPWVRNLCTHDRMGWDLRSMYRVYNCTMGT